MKYLGDFPADQAIYFAWNTNDSDGASITRSGDGTISVYKDNSNGSSFDTTQVTTGVTNDEDFDALTGVHTCCITTTNAWYETGHDYIVVLSASTIDTQTVNSVIAHFSIENRFMRGTNSAALAATALSDATWTAAKAGYLDVATSSRNATTPPTVTAIRQEMDANSTKMAPSQTLNDYKATGFSTHNAAAIWAVGTRALTDKSGFALSTDGIDALWDDLTSGMIQVGSIGKLIADNLDAAVSSRNATTPPTVIEIRTEMDNNSTKMAPSQTLNDYKATGFNTTTPPTVGEIRTEMEGVGTKLTLTLEDTAELQGNQADWATATSVTVSDKTGFSLSTAGVDAILDENIEGVFSFREIMRLLASAMVGKVSGGGTTTIVFRDLSDTKNRITATVTDVGNRESVVLDES